MARSIRARDTNMAHLAELGTGLLSQLTRVQLLHGLPNTMEENLAELARKNVKKSAFKFLKGVLDVSPYNTSGIYCAIELKKSMCTLYIPVAKKNEDKATSIKEYMQRIADEAGL